MNNAIIEELTLSFPELDMDIYCWRFHFKLKCQGKCSKNHGCPICDQCHWRGTKYCRTLTINPKGPELIYVRIQRTQCRMGGLKLLKDRGLLDQVLRCLRYIRTEINSGPFGLIVKVPQYFIPLFP